MTIAVVQVKSTSYSPLYVNISPTAGNAIVIGSAVSSAFGGAPTGFNCMSAANGGGTVLASFTIPAAASNTNYAAADLQVVGGYVLNIPSGVASIIGTYSGGTPGYGFLVAVELSGVDNSTGFVTAARNGQNTPGTAANAITSGTVSVSSAAKYLVGICMDGSQNGTAAAGTGFTALAANANSCIAEGQAISSSGTYGATFTDATHGTTDAYGILMFALAPTASGTAYSLTAAQGSYSVTGEIATKAASLGASEGAFTLTGNAATLTHGTGGTPYNLVASVGMFSLSGEAATRDLAIPASEGSYGLTGFIAQAGYGLGASEGSFGLTGMTASLIYSTNIPNAPSNRSRRFYGARGGR